MIGYMSTIFMFLPFLTGSMLPEVSLNKDAFLQLLKKSTFYYYFFCIKYVYNSGKK